MEFDFDFDVSPKPKVDPNATMFATIGGEAADLGNGECIFRPIGADRVEVMTHQVLAALDRCRTFRSADEHVDAIRQAMPGAPLDGIRRVFNGLVERGLIVAAEDFAAGFLDAAKQASPRAEVGGMFIRAGDRPAALQRLLESLDEHTRRGFSVPALNLVDGEQSSESTNAKARLLREFGERHGVAVQHIDAVRAQRIQETLAAALPEQRAAIDDLIGRTRGGAARVGSGWAWNLAALLGAGKRILFGEDEFVLPLKLHPELQDGIVVEASAPTSARFFADQAAAMSAGHDAEFDLLQWHLEFCGAPIGRVFEHESRLVPTRAQWRGMAPSRLAGMAPKARIVATLNGRRGQGSSSASDWMFQIDPASARDLCAERNRYLRLIESGKAWIGPDRAMTMRATPVAPFAQDLSQLPAFVAPDERGEQFTYGAITRVLDPSAVFLHLPTAVGQWSERDAPYRAPGQSPVARTFNAFLVDFLARLEGDVFAASSVSRLAAVAARLEDLAGASNHGLLRLLGDFLQASHSAQIQRLQMAAEAAGPNAPVYWSADLQAVIKAHAKALLIDGPPRLAGWPTELDADACATRLRDELMRFARMMRAWPAVWEAAREMGARGRLG